MHTRISRISSWKNEGMIRPSWHKSTRKEDLASPVQVVADCSLHHTEISLVSDWSPNLSFYSMMQPLASDLQQVALPSSLIYNPNHTYLAVVNSDGDNMQVRPP